MKKDLIIWGATGQCIVLEEFLNHNYNILALFDRNEDVISPINNIPIHHNENEFLNWIKQRNNLHYIVAIGGKFGKIRVEISNKLEALGLKGITSIHPKAVIADNVIIGKGVQILINATIATRVIIGNYCIVNTSSSIDHECRLEDGVHIAPGATLAGCVSIGKNTFIGIGATILPSIKIGENSIIGAGSVVTKNIPANCVAYGVPAVVIKQII